jgi:putative hydrolase of the HAD superfamily
VTVPILRENHKEVLALFDTCIFSYETSYVKSNPKTFPFILQQIAKKPEECIFIDDKQKNIDRAEKAGIKGIVHTSTKETIKQLNSSLQA